jgi:alkylation response protein AidB-like acyl-CoA dehydrogenase
MPKPENIIPHKFKKGQSGNPNGRPKLPDLKEALAKVLGEEKDGMNAVEAILKALRAKAANGDVRAAELLLNRGFGQALQKIEQKNEGEQSVTIKVIRDEPNN